MIARYQIGPYRTLPPWRALRLATTLMRRLEPEARIIVTHQGDAPSWWADDMRVEMYRQDAGMGLRGRHSPPRISIDDHEVWLDNDHIMWQLPDAWNAWKAIDTSALLWRVPWGYYGRYDDRIRRFTSRNFSAGMFGLPPGAEWASPASEETPDESDEMGWVITQVFERAPNVMWAEWDEVRAYCPSHPVLGEQCRELGTCGVHLMGLNRSWNPEGEALLDELEKRYL